MQAEENKIWQIKITDFYLEEHAPSGGCYEPQDEMHEFVFEQIYN